MQKIINITGMGCEGCAAKVKKALEALPAVEGVKVDNNRHQLLLTLGYTF